LILPWDQKESAEWKASCHQFYLTRAINLLTEKKTEPERIILSFTGKADSKSHYQNVMLPGMGSAEQQLKSIKILEDFYLFL
jgi:hypothetical protein